MKWIWRGGAEYKKTYFAATDYGTMALWVLLWVLCSLEHREKVELFSLSTTTSLSLFCFSSSLLFCLRFSLVNPPFIYNFSRPASLMFSFSFSLLHTHTHTCAHNESMRWSPHSRIFLCHWAVFITPSISQTREYVTLFAGPRPPKLPPSHTLL